MKHSKLLALAIIATALFSNCKKNPEPVENNSTNLSSGRAGISFTTDINFGNSKTFNVSNTSTTIAVTQLVGTSRRYMVLKAETTYGGLTDIVKATLYITVGTAVTTTPIIIDLTPPSSSSAVQQAQVEMYYRYSGGIFGNTYRSVSGELKITKLSATEIEGNFTTTANGSIAPGFQVTNGKFAGKF